MLRTSRQKIATPVYRVVLAQALSTAWQQRRFWPLAFFAAMLLTGGTYDVVWKALSSISDQAAFSTAPQIASLADFKSIFLNLDSLVEFTSGLQVVIVLALALLTVVFLSCVSQAGLVYGIGATHRGQTPSLADAIRVGGRAFWPVAALNALTLTTMWILRFAAVYPLTIALQTTTEGRWFLYLLATMLVLGLFFVLSLIQIFALNAMVLQGAPAQDAIIRAYNVFKRHWIVCIETALLLWAIAFILAIIFSGLFFIVAIPLMAAVLTAAVLQSPTLLLVSMGVGFGLLIVSACLATSFITQLQYATWTALYRKLGEGGVLPKIHRLARALSGSYQVPE